MSCFVSDRARVTKGLPDMVAIKEDKVSPCQHSTANTIRDTIHTHVHCVVTVNNVWFPLVHHFLSLSSPQSLCLTCFIEGEPAPEIRWLHNDKEIVDQAQFTITKEPKISTITVNNIKTGNSGKYSILVRNQFGCEKVDVTVSVYKHGEKPPANVVEMGL